ncbi:MAG: phosphoribosylamine--glycine ligase [Patescibacteria group bacterium]|nr:phosphoribosylamine--glycine ligase [Patescibacteria group bacterium]
MDILIIGSGAREHALAWKLKSSPKCGMLYVAPGNAGTAMLAENVALDVKDNHAVVEFAREKGIGLVVIGPDDHLAAGLADWLFDAEIPVFGPRRGAARLEWSKAFAKDFMHRHHIPAARSQAFSVYEEALHYLRNQFMPVVIKADGLALGKGVVIAETHEAAERALRAAMVEGAFGEAGRTAVIEEFLEGKEISVHVLTDGMAGAIFPPSKDHKRAYDEDQGPNTGGMGVIAPVSGVAISEMDEIREKIIMPVIRGMAQEGNVFQGILYPGIMLTKEGPKVIEFNARFGDPECESYMRLLESDLLELMLASANGTLKNQSVSWSSDFAVTVMLASAGYPGEYQKGFPISGLEEATSDPSIVVFHAGTTKRGDEIVTAGGRVLGVSAVGKTLAEARERAYAAVQKISFEGMRYRSDIGSI